MSNHRESGGYGVNLNKTVGTRLKSERHLVNIKFMNGIILYEVLVLSDCATNFGILSSILDKRTIIHKGIVYPTINIFSIEYLERLE